VDGGYRARMRRVDRQLVLGLTLVAVGIFSLGAQTQVPPAAPELGSATADPTSLGVTIPGSFLGFSHEWSGGQELMGDPATATNPVYRQLIQNLLAYGAGPFVVRIGGNSTDRTGEPQPDTTSPFAQLFADLGVQFTLGVNLGGGDPNLAADQARAYVQGMPAGSLTAIEIGNEPDLYHANGDRPASYDYADYARDFATWRSAISPSLAAGVGLMGPSWSSAASLRDLDQFLDQEAPNLALVSHHWYAGTQCNGRTNPPDYLLRPESATSGANAVRSAVALAHVRSLPFRMGEMNSISCGGEPMVSDTFASALWAADTMFELANAGVDGVNIHTGNGGAYALFTFDRPTATSGFVLTSVRPSYYGLLFFQQAAPAGSRLVAVSTTTSANLKVWCSEDASRVLRVAAINKDQAAGGTLQLQVPSSSAASLVRLQAPSLESQTGVTLGGQTFDHSPDGTLQGVESTETVVPAVDGSYTFVLPPLSAALLTTGP